MKKNGDPQETEEFKIACEFHMHLCQGNNGRYSLKKGSFKYGSDYVHYTKILKRVPIGLIFTFFGLQLSIPSSTTVPVFAIESGGLERKLVEGRNFNPVTDQRFYFVSSDLTVPGNISKRLSELGLRQTENSRYYQ